MLLRSTTARGVSVLFTLLVALCGVMLSADAPGEPLLGLGVSIDGLAVLASALRPPIASSLRRGRGRPRKFAAPSRAITLTIPESVLETLAAIDPDPSRAIVQLAKRAAAPQARPPAELAVFGRRAVITIRPSESLEKRTGVHLVPLPDGRALISFDEPKTIADLELLLYDALDDPTLDDADRAVFEGIGSILREARRSSDVTLLHRSIIVLESSDLPHSAAATPVRRRAAR